MHTRRGNKNKLNQTSVSLQSSPSSIPVESDAAEVREAKRLEEDEKAERERVAALLRRKKLLQELGLVEQLHRLLQGCTQGGAATEEEEEEEDGSRRPAKAQPPRRIKVSVVQSHPLAGGGRPQCLCLTFSWILWLKSTKG